MKAHKQPMLRRAIQDLNVEEPVLSMANVAVAGAKL